MKKPAAAILLLIYFAVTTGFTVSVHYCMNKKATVELGHAAKKDCAICGMNIQKSKGCCKDDVRVVKMQADHNLTKASTPDFSFATLPVVFPVYQIPSLLSSAYAKHPLAHGPPLSAQDSYLINCVFRL